jgi:hypothetical protein
MPARRMIPALALLMLCVAAWGVSNSTSARAEVGDPTLRTDHPVYPGEGAFQSVADCVEFATRRREGAQDKALGLYLWMLTHQFHLASPQEPYVEGLKPDTQNSNDDLIVYDSSRARFSYAYGLCGTVHAWNEPYWRALGMPARRRAFPGHVNSEIEYDGGWHAFDTDMAGLVFRPDGVVAGYDDIIKDASIVRHSRPPLPCYPFAWPSDMEGMQRGWREVAAGGSWYRMYNAGYEGQPAIVHLRRGESFTRWFDRDHYGGPNRRRFWHHQPGGPFRDWTYVNIGKAEHPADGAAARALARGNASYANGEFDYRPEFSSGHYREGVFAATGNVAHRESSPRLYSRDGKPASVTFSHFSPYVICGDPADDSNPMTGPAAGGLIVAGSAVGSVSLAVSVNHGQTWRDVRAVSGPFEIDLTDDVKGRYGWWLRWNWDGGGGLHDLRFVTVTQVAQPIYPRLSAGGCKVVYRAASRAVAPVLPSFAADAAAGGLPEVTTLRSENVQYAGRNAASRLAYRVAGNKPGQIVFRVDSPRLLLELSAAARYSVRSPSPPNCDFRLDVSQDGGKSWHALARADVPTDNEFSSGWVYGRADMPEQEENGSGVRNVLVRVTLHGGGYQTGLLDAQFYGVYRTSPPQAATITYGWKESGQPRTHVENIPAGKTEHAFTVPTGAAIVDEFVRIEAR